MSHLPLFVLALPWAVALSLVWRATGHGDGPARLLRLVTAALPYERREWGRARR
ncbi:hypothetical protein [Nonomuraea terrae]|uniref:hypothetical protein n=1 Tax=Nonomuraea terrae TaxID=2530383 RepID=UPI0014048F69|nr:hypothetical protein [Nonomuraea terrae]